MFIVCRIAIALLAAGLAACGPATPPDPTPAGPVTDSAAAELTGGYREPDPAIVRLLTGASPPPRPLLHGASRQVALLFQEPVIDFERLARPWLGLAGYRYDPRSGVSGLEPLIERVEVFRMGETPAADRAEWRPATGARLAHVRFSPDGRMLSALVIGHGPARLALFDVESGRAEVLDVPVNPAWGEPCDWAGSESLICRLVPADLGAPPADRVSPLVIEHPGGPAPTRTWSNLLENEHEAALFEHYFAVELARVERSGEISRLAVTPGLISSVTPSPDGSLAILTRIQRPFSAIVPARQFPSSVELWDLGTGKQLYASQPTGFGIAAEDSDREDPRRGAWRPGVARTLGWIERSNEGGRFARDRWLVLDADAPGEPVELVSSASPIQRFGWTSAGTPWFTTVAEDGGVRVVVVYPDGPQELWTGQTANRYDSPGRGVRVNGDEGPVLEVDGRIFLAGDGLGPEGPQPFLDVLDLKSRETQRVFEAEPGVFEAVIGVLDPAGPVLLTSRETETEPPTLYRVQGDARTALRPSENPYPDLDGVTRGVVRYTRADGVALSGSLYLPAGWQPGDGPLPTLIWIYPYEFTDREQAEQVDVRAFRFHRVKGPSPLAAVLAGYALLVNPTVPILYEGSNVVDDYLPQLVASVEAAADHLIEIGVAEPGHLAVGGRSYGAFSAANLLIHSRRFATAIAMSGAYNRTLTPFGFQHEKRSFWDAAELYARISPFFQADQVKAPLLLVHGGADENPGTPPLQARRFVHALVGQGAQVRFVELPYEGHHYWARESVLHATAEMLDWLDQTIK